MATCGTEITPEDFFRQIVRTNGSSYALAVSDLTAIGTWVSPLECPDGLTDRDILMMIYDSVKKAANVVIV
jgi:hypothetical protein